MFKIHDVVFKIHNVVFKIHDVVCSWSQQAALMVIKHIEGRNVLTGLL